MAETVSLDKKGSLVLPKKLRKEAHISLGIELVVRVKGIGSVELSDPRILAAKAQEIGAAKLAGWNEPDHEATAYLLGAMKRKNETD